MAQFVAQRVGPASTVGSTVDRSTEEENQELYEGHPQLLFSSCFNSTGVAEVEAKEPFRQEERRRHPAAIVDAHVADSDARKKQFRKELHQDASRSQSCSETTFVQDVKFHVGEAGKEVYFEELGKACPHLVKVVKVEKVAFQWVSTVLKDVAVYEVVKVVKAAFQSAAGFFCCLPNGGGEFAVDEVESEPLFQERPQERRSNFVTCDDVGEGEGKKALYPQCHSKTSAVGENSDHTIESNYSNLAEAAQAIGGSASNVTSAKNPKQDMCVQSDDGDGDHVGGASAEFIATAVQRTDGLVESVARCNTAEHLVEVGIAAGDIITVNIAAPGQPAEVLGGLSLPGFLNTIEMCPYLSD